MLIASRPSMTFPNVIKTAPEHPNIALMYPIMIERGPAAGGEALTDNYRDKYFIITII